MLRLPSSTLPSLLLLLTSSACTELGERAETGQCPVERCSPAALEGLEFAGPTFGDTIFGDRDVKTTAVGGLQEVDLIDHWSGRPVTAEYQARTVAATLTVFDADGDTVTIEGRAAGSTTLKIEDDQGLLDQLGIEAAAIAEVVLQPDPSVVDRDDEDAPWLAWAGADAQLVIEISAADGERLVDQSMTITSSNGGSPFVTAWDVRRLPVDAAGIALLVDAGDLVEPVELVAPAATTIDAVTGRILLDDGPVEAGSPQLVCFDASLDGIDVLFVPWTFAAEAGAEVSSPLFGGDNCTMVVADNPGTYDIIGTVSGGPTVTVPVRFVASTSARKARAVTPAGAGPSLGSRAGGVAR